MMQISRLAIVTAIVGGLVWYLAKTVIAGIMTGAIRHTDSSRVCRRARNPAGFWALVLLFNGFIALLGAGWMFAIVDALKKMK